MCVSALNHRLIPNGHTIFKKNIGLTSSDWSAAVLILTALLHILFKKVTFFIDLLSFFKNLIMLVDFMSRLFPRVFVSAFPSHDLITAV